MNNQTSVERQIVTLEAGKVLIFYGTIDSVNCHRATGPIKIQFGDGNWTDWTGAREYIPPAPFQNFQVHNPGGSAVEVELSYGQGRVRDYGLRVENERLSTRNETPSIFDAQTPLTVAAGTVAQIAAAAPTRAEIGLVNMGAETVWARGDAVASIAGHPIEPGQTLILTTTAALFVYNPGAGGADIARWSTEFTL